MAEVTPHYEDGPITFAATAALTGGQVVEVTGNMSVGPAADASQKVAGVAARDVASGLNVLVYRPDDVFDLVASGAIAAGDQVCAAAAGKVRTWVSGTDSPACRIGTALEAIANLATGRVAMKV